MTAPQGTVWKAMWRQHGKTFMIAGFIKLVHDCVMFLGPFVLEQLLIFLEKGGTICKHSLAPTDHVLVDADLTHHNACLNAVDADYEHAYQGSI